MLQLLLCLWSACSVAAQSLNSNLTYAELETSINSSQRVFSLSNVTGLLSPPTYGQVKVRLVPGPVLSLSLLQNLDVLTYELCVSACSN